MPVRGYSSAVLSHTDGCRLGARDGMRCQIYMSENYYGFLFAHITHGRLDPPRNIEVGIEEQPVPNPCHLSRCP